MNPFFGACITEDNCDIFNSSTNERENINIPYFNDDLDFFDIEINNSIMDTEFLFEIKEFYINGNLGTVAHIKSSKQKICKQRGCNLHVARDGMCRLHLYLNVPGSICLHLDCFSLTNDPVCMSLRCSKHYNLYNKNRKHKKCNHRKHLG